MTLLRRNLEAEISKKKWLMIHTIFLYDRFNRDKLTNNKS